MLIDGKKIAERIIEEIKKEVESRKSKLKLAAVLVGNDAGSRRFLELKQKAVESVGIDFRLYEFPEDISTSALRKELAGIGKASVNSCVLVELPLPKDINTQYILNAIPPEKDVDVLSQRAQGAFYAGRSAILPPAVEAVKMIFEEIGLEPKGLYSAVFGYGLLVGKPVVHWLLQNNASVAVINEFTKNPEEFSKYADVIVSGVGKAGFITADMVRDGATVIDFGFTDGKGDVVFDEVSEKAGAITPVPGGVGPVVVAAVIKNLVKMHKKTA